MNDAEIYDLAADVLGTIVGDLSMSVYSNGSLSIGWSPAAGVQAWAESLGDPEQPPNHKIVITYDLIRQFYRDAENFYSFCEQKHFEREFEVIFKDYDPKPQLPAGLTREGTINNMFLGALTWIFFHELGHLAQEHGYIRSKFSGDSQVSCIYDCEADGSNTMNARAASISHVTEFAADEEATQSCMEELMRHFLFKERKWTNEDFQSFQDTLYLATCGIACALYRFHGERPVEPEPFPLTSHPTPIRRLEVLLPTIFEKLDLGGKGEALHGLDRKKLVYLTIGAADTVGFFWLFMYANEDGMPDNFLVKGLLQDPHLNSYWGTIIDTWDEICSDIKSVRRFGSDFGLLSFTDLFRAQAKSRAPLIS